MKIVPRVILVRVLGSFAFWIPIWTLFAKTKGIDLQQTYSMLAIYSLLVVLLEYPTGIIGDAISHKLSTGLGLISVSLGYLTMLFLTGYNGLFLAMSIVALGTSLLSGSDEAYFHSITPNYRKEYPRIKIFAMSATLIGIFSGSILFQFNTDLPIILNVITIFVAFLIFITLPKEKRNTTNSSSNPFYIAKKGLTSVFKNKQLLILLLISALVYSFSSNLKWLYGNIFLVTKIDSLWWGGLITLFYLGRFAGITISQKIKRNKNSTVILFLTLANLIFLMGYILHPVFIVLMILLAMIIIGIIETETEITAIETAETDVKASVLSLKGLMGRLSGAFYIFIAGTLTSDTSLFKITTLTFAIFLFGVGFNIYYVIRSKEE